MNSLVTFEKSVSGDSVDCLIIFLVEVLLCNNTYIKKVILLTSHTVFFKNLRPSSHPPILCNFLHIHKISNPMRLDIVVHLTSLSFVL